MISARPELIRSTVAKRRATRTGSRTLSTVTALVSRIVLVRAAIAASTTAGDDTAKSWLWGVLQKPAGCFAWQNGFMSRKYLPGNREKPMFLPLDMESWVRKVHSPPLLSPAG